jgi:hypothetical protein
MNRMDTDEDYNEAGSSAENVEMIPFKGDFHRVFYRLAVVYGKRSWA